MAIYLDTETCGLTGPICLLQYAKDDSQVELYNPWFNTVNKTLEVFESIVNDPEGVVGFNLAFDWFHICQMGTVLLLLKSRGYGEAILKDIVEPYALAEPEARNGPCFKPVAALDLMLYARKGPYQSTMKRDDIRIRKVPKELAWELAKELDDRVKLKDLYFTRKKKGECRWKVLDRRNADGTINIDFKDVVLAFSASSALKTIAIDALGLDKNETLIYSDISVSKKVTPKDKKRGYAPFALAFGKPGDWGDTWPAYIRHHYEHWQYNELARKYGSYDVIYLQQLRSKWGNVPLGDTDSNLACMVGAVRWHGYSLDIPYIKELIRKADADMRNAPMDPKKVKWYLSQVMDETERLVFLGKGSTKKQILEELARDMKRDCPECKGSGENCTKCAGEGTVPHPAGERAKQCLRARQSRFKKNVLEKLLVAGRFHAAFKVVGTKSNRMAGDESLNAQGMGHEEEFRRAFTLVDTGYEFIGGDFESFEPSLAEAVYADPALRKDLLSGKKVHALFALELFTDKTYEQIVATKYQNPDLYDIGKRGFLAICYGGDENTLYTKLNIDKDVGKRAIENFVKRKYRQMGIKQSITKDKFCSMRQPDGIGTRVIWKDPADYIESKAGARRYFTLENEICKVLYNLANSPPGHWKDLKIKVQRRAEGGRPQFVGGATQSALYAAAFGIQSGNMRAAVNHEIQSWGGTLCKELEHRLWGLQPAGISEFIILPMNVHDELLTPTKSEYVKSAREIVEQFVKDCKEQIPLLAIDWRDSGIKNWADLKG